MSTQRYFCLHLENVYIRAGLGASVGVVANARPRSPMYGEILWKRLTAYFGFDQSWDLPSKRLLVQFPRGGSYDSRLIPIDIDVLKKKHTDGKRKTITVANEQANSTPTPHWRYAFRYVFTNYTRYTAGSCEYTGSD